MGKRDATYTAKDVADAVDRVLAGERVLPVSRALNIPYKTLHDVLSVQGLVMTMHHSVGDLIQNFPRKQKTVFSSGWWLVNRLGIL
jgi:hypothetical protein